MPSGAADTTDDAVLGGRLRLLQPATGHRAGHDAILLAAAAPAAKHAVDLGAGVGTAGLALLARGVAERVALVEIDAELAGLARENAKRNGHEKRAEIIVADIRKLARDKSPVSLSDLVIANPPFNDPVRRNISPDAGRRRAHAAADSELDPWLAAAERMLEAGGRLVFIHRPEAIETMLASLAGRFGAVEIIPIFPRPAAAAIRVIVRAIKGRRTPLSFRPGLVLNDAEGRPTAEAEAILRNAAPLDPA
ncbi:MAG TPA: methyltransferase [Xanthobacteraceae bacterium]|nr:methyltransferase [Xanthobacteraceae bacterium]